jgi:hypothetical protein
MVLEVGKYRRMVLLSGGAFLWPPILMGEDMTWQGRARVLV